MTNFSDFGEKFNQPSGIYSLMEDLGRAMAGSDDTIMLGGGNPAPIPKMQKLLMQGMKKILKNPKTFNSMIGDYDPPQGNLAFIDALTELFRRECGWKITRDNVGLSNGSQSSFFHIFNCLAGPTRGRKKKILLPLTPEYIGYADLGIQEGMFDSCAPRVEFDDEHTFKYHIDFDKLKISPQHAAICVSRPTNPTGNVVTDEEIVKLDRLAKSKKIPLIIDNAYGAPFPNIIFNKVTPFWNPNVILTMSLSKLGLPATRLGIVVAHKKIISALANFNAIASLAGGSVGPALMLDMVKNKKILDLSEQVIRPFYKKRAENARRHLLKVMDPRLPYALHRCEGSMFLWLWCRDFPASDMELYERLKKQKVLVVPGRYFFFNQSPRKKQPVCLRINYALDPKKVRAGLSIIAKEIERSYRRLK